MSCLSLQKEPFVLLGEAPVGFGGGADTFGLGTGTSGSQLK
jgi:hypothetical protein